ncbi:MAG: glycosyltransferase family 2 protein [Cyclobacteriaceae bacterium]
MKISIITVTLNSEKTLRDTIESIQSQTYKDIEYIIIDGKSTDNTLSIVKEYDMVVSQVISETDSGLYDAMNKGLKMATGEVIGILNSDDFYSHNKVLEKIAQKIKETSCDVLYADINYVDPNNPTKIVRQWISQEFGPNYFEKGYVPAHPTVFIKKKLVKKYTYNLNFKLAADYDWLLRLFSDSKVTIYYFHGAIINMRLGGVTSKGWFNILKGNLEITRSWWINKRKIPLKTLLINRPRIKLKQFV